MTQTAPLSGREFLSRFNEIFVRDSSGISEQVFLSFCRLVLKLTEQQQPDIIASLRTVWGGDMHQEILHR